jgi:hypothetical protein
VHLSATYIIKAARDRKSRWTISQKCEWQVKRFELASRVENRLGGSGLGAGKRFNAEVAEKNRREIAACAGPARSKSASRTTTCAAVRHAKETERQSR